MNNIKDNRKKTFLKYAICFVGISVTLVVLIKYGLWQRNDTRQKRMDEKAWIALYENKIDVILYGPSSEAYHFWNKLFIEKPKSSIGIEMWVDLQFKVIEERVSNPRNYEPPWKIIALQEMQKMFYLAGSLKHYDWLKEKHKEYSKYEDKKLANMVKNIINELDKIINAWGKKPTIDEVLEEGFYKKAKQKSNSN